ncbi:MAG TPA: HlyD family efflux transporter periplasmic adaptor subunit [Candidatus Dormibacteraeota bacterium]|nr:HlyD family efflux transporter periplasmic adaptor subunit [Candidatus Dormibacteraeota bacterium]
MAEDEGELTGRPASERPRTTRTRRPPATRAAAPAPPPPPPVEVAPPAGGGRMSRRTRLIAIAAIATLAVLIGIAFTYSYLTTARQFISTDNANIDGDQIVITAPATGTLLTWKGQLGSSFSAGDVIATLRLGSGSGVNPMLTIRAPQDGVVAAEHALPNDQVTQGSTLATAYDLNQVFVTARVDETAVGDIHPGQTADILVDAFSTPLVGTVQQLEGAAASVFSLLPQSNSTGNFQKVTQEIPVKIVINDTKGLHLVPGMSCTVKIHRN